MLKIERHLTMQINDDLQTHAGVVLLGPRQIGKTTLALDIARQSDAVYLDLEDDQDRQRLSDPRSFFDSMRGKLVVLDEVQTMPDLFRVLRGVIDRNRQAGNRTGQFLLLGSASEVLLRQSSESLAGRVQYRELGGINLCELPQAIDQFHLWLRGGYPDSLLAASDEISFSHREALFRAVIERDVPQIAGNYPGVALRRFWRMIAHSHGEVFNAAKIGGALEMHGTTMKRYLDLFEDLMLMRRLQPWFANTKKRLIKSPKVYIRDSGVLHTVLGLKDMFALRGHPAFGHSWEGFVIEQITQRLPPSAEVCYYRTVSGAEIDLVIDIAGTQRWAIEIKATATPKVSQGFRIACDDISATRRLVVHTGDDTFSLGNQITAMGLNSLLEEISSVVK